MTIEMDYIAHFAKSKNFNIRPRTIFVEGTTDVDLFELAVQCEKVKNGVDLLGDELAIVAAGLGNDGGTRGICRELVSFKNMARYFLLHNGKPKYRFIGLFDNDNAGRRAIHDIRKTDTSILEFKDVFRLWPVMPLVSSYDPSALQKKFEMENINYNNLDWELEDLLPNSLVQAFLDEFPSAVIQSKQLHDKIHRDWTRDGKARLHRFVKTHAIHADLINVINVIRSLRYYLGLKVPGEV
jgi:hypothetical protein